MDQRGPRPAVQVPEDVADEEQAPQEHRDEGERVLRERGAEAPGGAASAPPPRHHCAQGLHAAHHPADLRHIRAVPPQHIRLHRLYRQHLP